MGWSQGTTVMKKIANKLKEEDEGVRRRLYPVIIAALQDADWDNEFEVKGIDEVLDEILYDLRMQWFKQVERNIPSLKRTEW